MMLTRSCLSDAQLHGLLHDDVPHGDLTTDLLRIGAARARIEMRLRAAGVLAGVEEAVRLFALAGVTVEATAASGSHLTPGELFLAGEGNAGVLHAVWKTAQTLVEYASGVATRAAAIVAAARVDGERVVPVACTRKIIPGTKALAIKAIRSGGAWPHRLGLSDTVLVFPEHRVFISAKSPAEMVAQLRACSPERALVAEVTTVDEAISFAQAGIDVVQLEKFTPEGLAHVRAVFDRRRWPARIAAAGGVNERNAAAYAIAGADVLVTSAPYYAAPQDVAVRLWPAADCAPN